MLVLVCLSVVGALQILTGPRERAHSVRGIGLEFGDRLSNKILNLHCGLLFNSLYLYEKTFVFSLLRGALRLDTFKHFLEDADLGRTGRNLFLQSTWILLLDYCLL